MFSIFRKSVVKSQGVGRNGPRSPRLLRVWVPIICDNNRPPDPPPQKFGGTRNFPPFCQDSSERRMTLFRRVNFPENSWVHSPSRVLYKKYRNNARSLHHSELQSPKLTPIVIYSNVHNLFREWPRKFCLCKPIEGPGPCHI